MDDVMAPLDNVDGDGDEHNGVDMQGAADGLQRKDTAARVRRKGTQRSRHVGEAAEKDAHEQNNMPLPKRLIRAMSKRKPRAKNNNNDQEDDDDDYDYEFDERAASDSESQRTFPRHLHFDLQTPIDIQEGEEFNGLLAPGAYADEKQRAKADGGKLQRLVLALRGDHKEREAKLFRPTVFDPAAGKPGGEASAYIEDNSAMATMSKFPFCCCAARYCVAIGFVTVLVVAILGFFAWPRVPSISISSLSALAPATVTYDEANSLFGLNMPLRINYEIHSGNFYPLKINQVHVTGFDGVTGNKIIDTTLARIRVAPLRLQFYSESTTIHYLTSDMSDPALTDLFGKCAPRSATSVSKDIEGRPGALTIRFQLKVNVSNLGWLKQPIVTLNQNVECPE
ncbi:hypothetical protein GGI21_005075 [Coemansia aciculifera]|nr:hypothetical protein GGI21_005075 [Coemansia aciculifera]